MDANKVSWLRLLVAMIVSPALPILSLATVYSVAAPGGQDSLGCPSQLRHRLGDLHLPPLRPSHDCSGDLHARPGHSSAGSTTTTATPSPTARHALALHLPVPMRGCLALDLKTAPAQPTSHRATRHAACGPRPLAAVLTPVISSLVASSARIKVRIAIGSRPTEFLR